MDGARILGEESTANVPSQDPPDLAYTGYAAANELPLMADLSMFVDANLDHYDRGGSSHDRPSRIVDDPRNFLPRHHESQLPDEGALNSPFSNLTSQPANVTAAISSRNIPSLESPTGASWSLLTDSKDFSDGSNRQCVSLPCDISPAESSPGTTSSNDYKYLPHLMPGPSDDSDSEKIKNSLKSAWNNMKYG